MLVILVASAGLAGLTYILVPPKNYEADPLYRAYSDVGSIEGEILWVDAREEEAFVEQHWPGAILLNEDGFEDQIPAFLEVWNPDMTVLVYCELEGCDRSLAVANLLRDDFQIDNVFVLRGGWTELRPLMP
ncbi:MAG: rhodanese-like domain-containing protein [Pirellulales bacterium]|nr:rhodanese-like domain-containing protein [Pirellulales bacterium]